MAAFNFVILVAFIQQVVTQDTSYRLNTPIRPSSYDITITPHFNTGDDLAFTFDGEVSIQIRTTVDNVKQIVLHSQDLNYTASDIALSIGSIPYKLTERNPLQFDLERSFVFINLEYPLQSYINHTLKIKYRGQIRDDLHGFYRSSYTEGNVTKWLGATQMESTHARKVFPCFDEPEYKAIFTLTIDRPSHYSNSLTNTKMQTSNAMSNGYTREIFYPSPKMSTYLVAFLVSEFKGVVIEDAREIGVHTRPEAVNQTTFALEIGKKIVDVLSNYTGIDYYTTNTNLKLHHVALPDFAAGAMENWGLVKYREAALLYVPEESSPSYKYRTSQIIAHETAHMWFGDLVTCHWWSNTWLNEGFANYLQDLVTHMIEPELGSLDLMVTSSVYAAYTADEVPTSPPITNNNISTPSEIDAHFGTITYQKAGSIIRMINHLIGEKAFKMGLHYYLDANKFEVGYPDKLYSALSQAVDENGSLTKYPGITLTQIMESWITKAGYPVLNVDIDREKKEVTLTQFRFYINSSHSSGEIYQIPITYTSKSNMNFDDTKPAFIMQSKKYKLSISNISDDDWILFNLQESGFYRVNYENDEWKNIGNLLRSPSGSNIHHLNRAKIVNDLFAFVESNTVPFDILHEVLEFLIDESDYSVWFAALRGINRLRNKYLYDDDAVMDIDKYTLKLMDRLINDVGFDVKDEDSYMAIRNRMQILEYACKIGNSHCVNQAVALFREFVDKGTVIHPSLRPVVYCTGIRNGNSDDFDFLRRRMLTTNVANEALEIESALGCSRNQTKLNEYLEAILEPNSDVRAQDVTTPLMSVLSDHHNHRLAWDFVKRNYDKLVKRPFTMKKILPYLPTAIHTEIEFTEFENWLSNCKECSQVDLGATRSALQKSRENVAWARQNAKEILPVVRGAAFIQLPSFLLFAISLLTFTIRL